MSEDVDQKKRFFLKSSAGILGSVGIAGVITPFLSYLAPSKAQQAKGAPVKVDISTMSPGEQKTVLWRGKPVWIIKRTKEMVESLKFDESKLQDPQSLTEQQPVYAQNITRSIRPDILVLLGVCTHLGCSPTYRPDKKSIDEQWQGGFYCACHGSKFDLAGRVYKNVPAPINLEVPEYHFIDDQTLSIGSAGEQK